MESRHSLRVIDNTCDAKWNLCWLQISLNKSTAQISVTAESVIDSAEQFEF